MTLEDKAIKLAKESNCEWDTLPEWAQHASKKSVRKDAKPGADVIAAEFMAGYGREWRHLEKGGVGFTVPYDPDRNQIAMEEGLLLGAKEIDPEVETIVDAFELMPKRQLEGNVKNPKTSRKHMRYWGKSAAQVVHYRRKNLPL